MAHGPGLTLAIAEKRFAPGTPLFADFRLDVTPGSVVAIVGPSGIGKSSLLRLVAGIDTDFTGTIAIDGKAPAEAPPAGFLFQDPRLLPWLTALDNVRAADPSISIDAARAALAEVGLTGDGQAFPRQLSGGMQRRVALARALATNAQLLLLDEPFVSLDRLLVDELHTLLEQVIMTRAATVLLVTHLPEEAARLADRAVILAGRPAKIAGDLTLPVPRATRDRAMVEAYADQIVALAQR